MTGFYFGEEAVKLVRMSGNWINESSTLVSWCLGWATYCRIQVEQVNTVLVSVDSSPPPVAVWSVWLRKGSSSGTGVSETRVSASEAAASRTPISARHFSLFCSVCTVSLCTQLGNGTGMGNVLFMLTVCGKFRFFSLYFLFLQLMQNFLHCLLRGG